MSAVDVQTEIIIDRPAQIVSEYVTDPDNATSWYVNIKSVEWKTPRPLSLGSQIAFKAGFLGRQLAYIYQVVELDPGKKLIMRTADGPFPMETTYTWEQLEKDQTRMTLRNQGIPQGFSKLLAPFMSKMMRRANNKDLSLLKQILEAERDS